MSQIASSGAFAQHNHIVFETVRPWLDPVGYGGGRVEDLNEALARYAAAVTGTGQDLPTGPVVKITQTASLANPKGFFDFMRKGKTIGADGALNDNEVSGCNAIITAAAKLGWPIGDVAYALATAYHETNGTMQPIKEIGGPSYFTRMYDITGARPAKARELGNLSPGDGAKYAGRGYVQLTGKRNYEVATKKLRAAGLVANDIDLVRDPDLAMRQDIAAAIMILGMREGWFTGRDLDDDIPRDRPATLQEFVRSRDIINGTDKAEKIAVEAVEFQSGLLAGEYRLAA